MSKWLDGFESHAFHTTFNVLKESNKKIDRTSISDLNSINELARISKTLEYIDKYLKLVDPEINITNFTNNLNQLNTNFSNANSNLEAYIKNANIQYLTSTNTYIDGVLTLLTQFHTILPKVTTRSVSSMLKEYNQTLSDGLEQINLNETIAASKEIKSLRNKLIIGEEDESSIESSIDDIYVDFKRKYTELLEFYNETLNTEYTDTTKELIQKAKVEIEEDKNSAKENFIEFSNKFEELDKFYIKIFGELDDEEKRVGGLKIELDKRIQTLDTFEISQEDKHNKILKENLDKLIIYENDQQNKHKNLFERIEALLPGATSAGLANAYAKERDKFQTSKRIWSAVFICSLLSMGIFSSIMLSDIVDFTKIGLLISKILPINGLLIWLALFASKRRSESQRLEQEYIHKEALAKSYSSYKKQIDDLGQKDEKLLTKLLELAIVTISKNPSDELDKKHGDDLPIVDIIKEVGRLAKK